MSPNAIDAAAAITSNVHMADSSGGQFIAAGWVTASPQHHSRPDKEYVTSYRPEQKQRNEVYVDPHSHARENVVSASLKDKQAERGSQNLWKVWTDQSQRS